MLFHFIVVILWLHTKHDNKLIAMQATLSYACGISDIPLKGETIGQNLRQIAADRKSTRLNSSHEFVSRMPCCA